MRGRLAIAALLALTIGVGATPARGEFFQQDNIRIDFSGGFSPHTLPREAPAPVTIELDSSISSVDGSQPPALRNLEIALNSRGRLTTRGLPSCTTAVLQSTTTETALQRCRDALVGHGTFAAALDSTQAQIPARGKILAFNGSRGGRPEVLLHLYGSVPVQATFVLPLKIERRQKGQLGTVLATKIPVLAGGLGSITAVKLKIGRRYSSDGQRRSFLSASCSAPAGFELVPSFPFARGTFHFADGTRMVTPLNRECRVR
jgi:hypothetical protein